MLSLQFSSYHIESGTDEAGRGCLAGPVTAAAVILPEDFSLPLLNDSKQLSERTREKLKPIIEEKAITFAITHIHPNEIDEINDGFISGLTKYKFSSNWFDKKLA